MIMACDSLELLDWLHWDSISKIPVISRSSGCRRCGWVTRCFARLICAKLSDLDPTGQWRLRTLPVQSTIEISSVNAMVELVAEVFPLLPQVKHCS